MATGDREDFASRMRRVLPPWFGDENTILDALLAGLAATQAWLFSMVAYVRSMMRIKTAAGEGLDLIAKDFFARLARRDGEGDESFRRRIRRELLREKATRRAMVVNLAELTGHAPQILEPWNTADTGGIGTARFAFNAAGRLGSRSLPHQCFVTAYRTLGGGPGGISGFDDPPGGLGVGRFALQSPEALAGGVTDEAIRECVQATKPAGVVVWLRVRPPSEALDPQRLDVDWTLDASRLD